MRKVGGVSTVAEYGGGDELELLSRQGQTSTHRVMSGPQSRSGSDRIAFFLRILQKRAHGVELSIDS